MAAVAMTPRDAVWREDRVRARLDALAPGVLAWCEALCLRRGVRLEDVLGRGARPRVVRARHEVWRVVGDTHGLSSTETAALFGVHYTTILDAAHDRERRIAKGTES